MSVTPEDIRRRLNQQQTIDPESIRQRLRVSVPGDPLELTPRPSKTEAFARGAGSMFLDNLIGLGNLALTAGARLATGHTLVDGEVSTPGVDPESMERLNQPTLPRVGERVIPVTGDQALAAIEAPFRAEGSRRALPPEARGEPGAANAPITPFSGLRRGFEEARQRQSEVREAEPDAFGGGGIAADIATIATGRAPFARALSRRGAQRVTDKQVADSLEAIARTNPELAPRVAALIGSGRLSSPGSRRMWQRFLESSAGAALKRSLGKAAETGLEGATLAVLKENDPLQIGALAAGGQLATNTVGGLFGAPSSMKGLAVRAGAYLSLFRLGQEFIPFSDKDTFAAIDASFNKLQIGLTLGVLSQLAGGRLRGSRLGAKLAEDAPLITDAINTVPRAGILSLVNRVKSEEERGEDTSLRILGRLQSNPEALGRYTAQRLDKALKTGKWDQEMDRLMKLESFRSRLEDLDI